MLAKLLWRKSYMTSNRNSRKIKDNIAKIIIYTATTLTILTLLVILGFVFRRGLPGINKDF